MRTDRYTNGTLWEVRFDDLEKDGYYDDYNIQIATVMP